MHLRPFLAADLPVLLQYQFPGMSEAKIQDILNQWQTKQYNGHFFEMLAVVEGGTIVGNVSVLACTPNTVNEGVEIYPPYRRKGYAFQAVSLLLNHAVSLGYTTAIARIRQSNEASLALHKKLGFQIIKEDITSRGHPVYELSKSMEVHSNGIQKHNHHPQDCLPHEGRSACPGARHAEKLGRAGSV